MEDNQDWGMRAPSKFQPGEAVWLVGLASHDALLGWCYVADGVAYHHSDTILEQTNVGDFSQDQLLSDAEYQLLQATKGLS